MNETRKVLERVERGQKRIPIKLSKLGDNDGKNSKPGDSDGKKENRAMITMIEMTCRVEVF